ncbi:unnamed protein product [Macrosiphum euphorbiae]|uniref:Uncharacterized protein n=1 Tax=Macrosiphum euphorbiae TaxID=13131 RepID=A0AAV0XGA8_9HEMI|nr:unnamed protein product [Macrosiphum euphorbiae]
MCSTRPGCSPDWPKAPRSEIAGEMAEVKIRGTVLSLFPIVLAICMLGVCRRSARCSQLPTAILFLFSSTVFEVLILYMLPESPYCLMQSNWRDKVEKSLRRI